MSSSRRSDRGSAGAVRCPLCGARSLERRNGRVKLQVRGETFVLDDVSYERCARCRRKLFDYSTSQRMDAVVLGKTKSVAA
ncbi:MAG: YgiT-type zinc finger protein [Nitrospirae bacterium]|nr:YgiT-type zinc finger protein [Nitrospirota bacterium]